MTEKLFLLVCEGETDIYIFEALATHFSNDNLNYQIKSLAPEPDATNGTTTYPAHGYGNVLNWCSSNREDIQLFIDFEGAEGIFIQMDTDIALKANPRCSKACYSERFCCEQKINMQLGTTEEPPRCHYILPTQNTETWILASHYSPELEKIENFELITDTEQQLIALGYKSKKGVNKHAPRKLNKYPAENHKKYAKQLINNLSLARQRCAELDRLCCLLEQA